MANLPAIIGVAFLVGGGIVVASYREKLGLARNTIEIQKAEIEVRESTESRLAEEKAKLEARVTMLEARPNLEQHAALLSKLLERAEEQTDLLREIRTATVPPA